MSDGKVLYEVRADGSFVEHDLDEINRQVEGKAGGKLAGAAKSIGTAIGAGLAAAGAASIKFGMDFETSMAKASTLFGDVEVDSAGLNKKMLALSDASGIAADQLGGALYNALSAGVPATEDMGEAMSFLESSAKLATAGFTDIDTAQSATIKTMNAYGAGIEEADKYQKMLIQTQNKGITTVGELGGCLAQVTPTAAAMGVGFDQVSAAIANMTAKGTPAAQATTQLNSLFAELGKSGTTAEKNLKKAAAGTEHAGKSFQDLMAEGVPLNEVLDMMGDYADRNGLSMLDMFSSVEAGKAALSNAGANADGFTDALSAMQTETDVVGESFDKMANTTGFKLQQFMESLKNTGIELFNEFQPYLNELLPQLTAAFKQVLPPIMELAAKLLPLFGDALVSLMPLITSLCERLLPPIAALLEAILPPLMGILEPIIQLVEELLPVISSILEAILPIVQMFVETLLPPLVSLLEAISPILQLLAEAILPVIKTVFEAIAPILEFFCTILKYIIDFIVGVFTGEWSEGWQAIGNFFTNLWQGICDWFNGIIQGLADFFTETWNSIKAFAEGLWQSICDIAKAIWQPIADFFMGLWEGISTAITDTWNAISQFFTDLWNGLVQGITDVWNGIKDFFNGILDWFDRTFVQGWRDMWQSVSDFFSGIWEGIRAAFVAPINWIIDGINWFIRGLNSLKIPDWVPLVGGLGFNIGEIPRLKVGMDYVPNDNFPAMLHRGEAVLTAAEAEAWRRGEPRFGPSGADLMQQRIVVQDSVDYDRLAAVLLAAIREQEPQAIYLDRRQLGHTIREVVV